MRPNAGQPEKQRSVSSTALGHGTTSTSITRADTRTTSSLLDGPRTISSVATARRGPGLRKARGLPLLHQRTLDLWQSADYRWRELFEAADVMSEGATRAEPEGPVYYGSTSVLLPLASRGGLVPDEDVARLSRMVAADPHARIRAVRIACLEAQLRSRGALGRVSAELTVRRDPRGIRIDVEVEASVLAEAEPPASAAAADARSDRSPKR
jgi:hypothetical protein